MDFQSSAKELIRYIGGADNIESVSHCFTRLRFVLKNNGKADKKEIAQLEGVISVVESGGQFQVVCGEKVEKYYDAVISIIGNKPEDSSEQKEAKESIGNVILQKITQMFTPLVPAIAAAGLIKGLLTAARLIGNNYGVDLSASDTYQILYSASQVIFYFMPIFLAMTSAKAMKCNQVIAMVIGGLLCYPTFDAMIQNVEVSTTIFGLPVIKGVWAIGESTRIFSYVESVIPILLVVIIMSFLEKILKKIIPAILQIILVPGLELIIMIPLALVILGPVGIYFGNVIQWLYEGVMSYSTVLGGALIGGLWGILVIFGAHRAVLPIGLNDVAMSGRQNLLAFAGAANFAQGGAAFGVTLRTKNAELKQIAASGTISAVLVGITEPAIYGVNLRLKKPMIYAVICGAVGGGIMGLGNVYGDAFANNGVLTIFTYAAFGFRAFVFYLVGIFVAFFGSAALTYFGGFTDIPGKETKMSSGPQNLVASADDIVLTSPIIGATIRLDEVDDEVFASKAMGEGIAFAPVFGEIVSPADGVVSVLYPTLHAIGLKLDSGVECIIHIGLNTAELKGQGFTAHIKEGQRVKAKEKLVTVDLKAVTKAGYSLITPLVIVNSRNYASVASIPDQNVTYDSMVLAIEKEK